MKTNNIIIFFSLLLLINYIFEENLYLQANINVERVVGPYDNKGTHNNNLLDGYNQGCEALGIEKKFKSSDYPKTIEEALGNLTSEQRDAIQLVYFFEMRQQEAADSLGLSLAALESLLRRARKKLHTVLNKNYEEFY